ncbi:putative dolichyl-P-Man:GDP-Man1GlcNAc2-PP-dolichyl alpha-1,3-mannosyltransferase [Trypanosoma rangeli]|uniref:Alpha-1,3/1,6-mannosyltransferase ALG2 n=1 Tax=Trypanosoma rangeli TaxID=5698 RepID=A0A3R7N194_TRYRA|nr:putative dolichyl-P-Man:GDP-Man1GlcNAc2-PP-dolichyl alpha-1,3-mannosyltransferase [Trypanosoma rangeli]RNF11182.1 putative dolichyl-P-Man:GDP-Man1GlcNAc2-PP-dolichyl alpha-1,3-mannosyltransferase [Trypanosoma rangeli]|eukprot:RNF11182.1 putative dolichyl-P-Man:GDP-Man1GlcNAc2-PP-dolichyl alpha-1,3-mannosyltransferase [Trypanosoma rangeli]
MLSFGWCILLCGIIFLLRLRGIEAALRRLRSDAIEQRNPTDVALQKDAKRPLQVVILHPDLGIGGAERLIIDAAVALQKHQHVTPISVTIVTNHHDPKRAFPETVDGTVKVVVSGAWLPDHFLGRAKVFCAVLRMTWAALMVSYYYPDTDCIFVDQVAAVLPLLRWIGVFVPCLFYCHFPDQCCDANREADGRFLKSIWKVHKLYRLFFDRLESRAMCFADCIASNSKFSREVTVRVFPQLESVIDAEADIFYPPVSWAAKVASTDVISDMEDDEVATLRRQLENRSVVLSINRYERKKNLSLAIEAFSDVVAAVSDATTNPPLLVIAGGYDARLKENVEYLKELQELAARHHLTEDQVLFLQNIADTTKAYLLSKCCCIVYTPAMEHFGIVPTEGMVCAKPIVAVNQGGPCESVGEGGTLCDPTPEAFASAIKAYVTDEELAKRVGAAGRQRALRLFGMDVFGEKLARRLVTLWTAKNEQLNSMQGGGKAQSQKSK